MTYISYHSAQVKWSDFAQAFNMAPKGPRFDRIQTKLKIQEANEKGIRDRDIIGRLQLAERHFYQCKAGDRGLPPRKLSLIEAMITGRTGTAPLTQQREFDFDVAVEVATKIEAPGSPFDLRLLKKKSERVWMVEIEPKKEHELTGEWMKYPGH